MKLAVVGSRTFCDYAWLEQCLLGAFCVSEIAAVISGGARGADALAARFAERHGIPLIVLRADWEAHGRKAGPIRNTAIVARADAVAAFWDGRSSGTQDTIAKARAAGRSVLIFPLSPGGSQYSESGHGPELSPVGRKSPERRRQLLFSDLLFPED